VSGIGASIYSMYLFPMVPDSRINSWESWFLFNLQINRNQHYEPIIPGCKNNSMISDYKIAATHVLPYIIEQRSSWSTSRIRPSWPCSRLKLSPILTSPCEHASCCHAQLGILLFIATVQASRLAPPTIWVASH
jgi:hypothetical protein